MLTRAAVTIALLLAAAGVASPQGEDAETRFHEAYLTEVVEGKVADAAKVYLELVDAPETPHALRAESRFRFAVCCVLLGRADEARTLFAQLLADPATPEHLKTRSREYAKAVEGIGVGSALEKKLDELVFELGRVRVDDAEPAVYRDFQIIGKPARPLLRKLLAHPDAGLRTHAFRILCRMDEPGMVEVFSRLEDRSNMELLDDIARWVGRHPDTMSAYEAALLTLPDELLRRVTGRGNLPCHSVEYLEALAGRGLYTGVSNSLDFETMTAAHWDMLERWLREGEDKLAALAAQQYVLAVQSLGYPEARLKPDLFRALARLYRAPRDLRPYAEAMPLEVLLSVFEAELEEAASAEESPQVAKSRAYLLRGLAPVLEMRDLSPEEVFAYAEIVRRWAGLAAQMRAIAWQESDLGARVTFVLKKLHVETAAAWARDLVSGSANLANSLASSFPLEEPRDVTVLLAAIEAAPERTELVRRCVFFPSDAALAELRVALLRMYPALVPLYPSGASSIAGALYENATRVPAEAAREALLAFVARAESVPEFSKRVLSRLFPLQPGENVDARRLAYLRDVCVPLLPEIHDLIDENGRGILWLCGLNWLRTGEAKELDLGAAREPIAEFLREHLDERHVRYGQSTFCRLPDLFPLVEWIPLASNPSLGRNSRESLGQERIDRAALELSHETERVNESVLAFILSGPSAAAQAEAVDRLLQTLEGGILHRLLVQLDAETGSPATEGALRTALDAELEKESPDLVVVEIVARIFSVCRPDERLFPAARALLASEDRQYQIKGIDLARSLGREELLPDLVRLLDSMDEEVRTTAKAAIDSILELRRIKQEARDRLPK